MPVVSAGLLPYRRRDGALHPFLLALEVHEVHGTDVGDRGARQREGRILGDGVLEHLQCELQVLARQPPSVAAAAEIQIVRLQVLGRLRRQRRPGKPRRDRFGHLCDRQEAHLTQHPIELGPVRLFTHRPTLRAGLDVRLLAS